MMNNKVPVLPSRWPREARQQSAIKAWLQAEAALLYTGLLEHVYVIGEPMFRVWVLCPRPQGCLVGSCYSSSSEKDEVRSNTKELMA